jgi:TIR domain-containing protein
VGGIFINYRGEDSQTAAVLIDRELAARFGSDQVFLDCRSIPAGADFVEELLGRLRVCSVLLVVIGPHWLTLTNAAGERRIDDPQDWIRREIVEAFTHGLRVVPVLTDGVTLPAGEELPDDIAGLLSRQDEHQLPPGRSHHHFLPLDQDLQPGPSTEPATAPTALIPNAAAAISLALRVARAILGK